MLPTFSVALAALFVLDGVSARCRSQPGQSGFPTTDDWATLNETVDGRLIAVVPSAKACAELGCTAEQWSSAVFRNTIPGQMNAVSGTPTCAFQPSADIVTFSTTGNRYAT